MSEAKVGLDRQVILPCPFCGGKPEIKKRKTVIIECTGCKALFIKMSETDAVKSWNTRTVDKLKKVCKRLFYCDGRTTAAEQYNKTISAIYKLVK